MTIFLPISNIQTRIEKMFPNSKNSIIIPTQHNELLSYNNYSGAEIDCYSSEFNRKVQLLIHFKNNRLKDAGRLKSILDHTYKYRSNQLFQYLDYLTEDTNEKYRFSAASITGTKEEIINFVRIYAKKLKFLLRKYENDISPVTIKNKLIRDFFNELKTYWDNSIILSVQNYIKAIKQIVKSQFDFRYFFKTEEIIEETKSLGGCILIPHPEQFWPILLADYDVDGYEVWNPQSREYTEFLIQVIDRHNKSLRKSRKPLLLFMGDDTHLSEKIKPLVHQDKDKAGREVGLQPGWTDPAINKQLIINNINRNKTIKNYIDRLNK